MEYARDGGVIPSSVPVSDRRPDRHTEMFGIYRGVILRAIYPDDPDSKTGSRMEYIVKVGGQEYPNAIDVSVRGGIFNYQERVRKGVEKSFTGEMNPGTYDENTDAESVWVMFIRGHGDIPLIIAGDSHPRKYKTAKNADGAFDLDEYNGVEFSIDKLSNLTFRQVGRKDPNGKILNPLAVGALIKVSGEDGSITANDASGKSTFSLTSLQAKLTYMESIIDVLPDGRFRIKNSSNELIDLIDLITKEVKDLSGTLKADTTNTIFGPMKLNAFAHYAQIESNLDALITRLETLKG